MNRNLREITTAPVFTEFALPAGLGITPETAPPPGVAR